MVCAVAVSATSNRSRVVIALMALFFGHYFKDKLVGLAHTVATNVRKVGNALVHIIINNTL